MNSVERVMTSLHHKRPDRIARFDSYWPEFIVQCKKKLGLSQNIDLDQYFHVDIGIICPDESIFPSFSRIISDDGVNKIYRNGWGATIRSRQGGYFEEELASSITCMKELETAVFEDASMDSRYQNFEQAVQHEKAIGKCVFGKIGGPYIRSSFIRGQEEYLYDIAANPEFVKSLAAKLTEHLIAIAKEELRRGNLYDTGIWVYDDMGSNFGPMMSPKSFETIYYPCYKRIVKELKAAGAATVVLHSDGNIEPLLDMLVDAGIDAINPVEPKAGMKISKIKQKFGNQLGMIGGMCNAHVLVSGSEDDVRRQAREIIEEAQDGGIIIGAHSIGPDIPIQNYLAYIDTLEQYGNFS